MNPKTSKTFSTFSLSEQTAERRACPLTNCLPDELPSFSLRLKFSSPTEHNTKHFDPFHREMFVHFSSEQQLIYDRSISLSSANAIRQIDVVF